MSLFSQLAAFARSPQGRRLASQAMRYARSPQGREKIAQTRQRLAAGRKPRVGR